MEKVVRIVKKGADDSNLDYWLSLTPEQRMANLQKIRRKVNKRLYPDQKGLQRVFKIVQKQTPLP